MSDRDPLLNPVEPIWVNCEGGGCMTHHARNGRGMCAMCGERVPTDAAGAGALPHRRLDIIAMLGRGDFDA